MRETLVHSYATLSEIPAKLCGWTRFVFISDTHSLEASKAIVVPDGDVLIHCGDFTNIGYRREILQFMKWFSEFPHKTKILIAGNHDITLEESFYLNECGRFHWQKPENPAECIAIVRSHEGIIYLQDEEYTIVHIHNDGSTSEWKVWGSPWQPEFCDWAFNCSRGPDIAKMWDLIPENTDILVTHGPPEGILDFTSNGHSVGCKDLMRRIKQVKPRIHAFGHIHEGYGHQFGKDDLSDCLFINASICTLRYKAENLPVVVDLMKKTENFID